MRDGEGWQPSDHRMETTSVCAIHLHPWVELGLILENQSVLRQWLVWVYSSIKQSLLIKKIKYLSLFFSLTGSVSTSYGQEMEILPNHKQHRKILLVVTVTRRWPMEIRQSPLPSLSKNLSSDSQRRAGGEKGMERTQSNCS